MAILLGTWYKSFSRHGGGGGSWWGSASENKIIYQELTQSVIS